MSSGAELQPDFHLPDRHPSEENMHLSTASEKPSVYALAIGAQDPDQLKLAEIFGDRGWRLSQASTLGEARRFIDAAPVWVVISERDLPDGGWREVLEDLALRPEPPSLIVTSRLADESLWAEVLNMGGFDVLAQPLDNEEVTRVIGAAARHFESERRRVQPPSAMRLRLAC
jgi:DNA-binding response OmpR family regulator